MNHDEGGRKPPCTRISLTGTWRRANGLVVCLWLAAAFANAQPGKIQPAPQPTTITPNPQLGAPHVALCMLADCNKPPKPVINGIDPSSTITPGGQVVVTGLHFNSNDQKYGDIVLTIGSKMGATQMIGQNIYTQPHREAHLSVLGWSDGHAYGQIPGDISGVMDGPASIQIRRSDGVASDSYTVQFKAAQDSAIYPATDMKWGSCSANADENQCDGWADFSDPRPLDSYSSIVGQHTKFLKSGSPESSDDYYTLNLKNGWTWHHGIGLTPYPVCTGDLSSYEVSNDTPTGGTIKVHWQAVCQITYNISFSIRGPRGVPWK